MTFSLCDSLVVSGGILAGERQSREVRSLWERGVKGLTG